MAVAVSHDKTFAEFFAGIGLVHLGLSRGNWKCVYANDIEPKKKQMYEGHFEHSEYYHVEDIWNTSTILDHLRSTPFLATASFPCVDLSLAGHWKGFGGERSSTYFGFIEVLSSLGSQRPPVVMLENVSGFLTSRSGRDFTRAIHALADLGYWIDALMLDARWFVPQSRPRLFVFGFHESLNTPLLVRRDTCALDAEWHSAIDQGGVLRPPALLAAMERLDLCTGWAVCQVPTPKESAPQLAEVIDTDDDQDWWDQETTNRHYEMMESPSRQRVDTLLQHGAKAVGTAFRRTRRKKTRTEVRFDIAGCLRTPKGGSAKQIVVAIANGGLRMRWMSAREYARLQGAASFSITVPPIQAMYGFGDAVCVPAIEWIDEQVLTPAFESASAPAPLLADGNG